MKQLLLKLKNIETHEDLLKFTQDNFIELQKNFYTEEVSNFKLEISDIFQDLIINNCIAGVVSQKTVIAFLELLSDFSEFHNLRFSINELANLLPVSATQIRLKAVYKFINDISTTSYNNFIRGLKNANSFYEETYKISLSYINKTIYALDILYELKNETKFNELKNHISNCNISERFIQVEFIDLIRNTNYANFHKTKQSADNLVAKYLQKYKHVSFFKTKGTANQDMHYLKQIESKHINSFINIRAISLDYFSGKRDLVNVLFDEMSRGVDIIETPELLNLYMFAYGNMHYHKIFEAIDTFSSEINNKSIEIIDWGCGQGIATVTLLDYCKIKEINVTIKKITLAEPSNLAINRATLHINKLSNSQYTINTINKDIDSMAGEDIQTHSEHIKIHLFSNIIDVPFFDINKLTNLISRTQKSTNYFVCVSPHINNERNLRLDYFYQYFEENYNTTLISRRENTKTVNKWRSNYCKCADSSWLHDSNTDKCQKAWTRYERVFKVTI